MFTRPCVLCCVLAGVVFAQDPLLTPEQVKFLTDAQATAVEASKNTEAELLKEFDSLSFRLGLLAEGRGGLSLAFKSALELLAELKSALNSLEWVFSFGYDAESAKLHPGQPAWSLQTIDEFGHIPTLWELKVDGKAAALPEAQWKLVDAEETGLYRQRNFAKHADPNMTEAALRPSYVSGNLAHLDAGIWEYGFYAPMYRQSALKARSVVAGLDGGGWSSVCNASASNMGKRFRWVKYFVPCEAIFAGGDKKVNFGTVDHLLHSFHANTRTFSIMGETLARRMYQLLAPRASMHPLEDNMYLEAVFLGPARMQDMKLFVASFPDLIGTSDLDRVREFCKRHRLPLAWALGSGKLRKDVDTSHAKYWFPYEPFVHWNVNGDRLLDPSSWDSVNAEEPSASKFLWAQVEAQAKEAREEDPKFHNFRTISSWWKTLTTGGGAVRGLRGKHCLDALDLCFGTSGDDHTEGNCLCRVMPSVASHKTQPMLV